MSAINVLNLPGISVFAETCCECVCVHAETRVPVIRAPIVSARWTVEINSDGTRRLVERWSVNQDKGDGSAHAKPESGSAPLCHPIQ